MISLRLKKGREGEYKLSIEPWNCIHEFSFGDTESPVCVNSLSSGPEESAKKYDKLRHWVSGQKCQHFWGQEVWDFWWPAEKDRVKRSCENDRQTCEAVIQKLGKKEILTSSTVELCHFVFEIYFDIHNSPNWPLDAFLRNVFTKPIGRKAERNEYQIQMHF